MTAGPLDAVAEAATRKLGPFPAWVYGLALGAGIVGYQQWRKRQDAPAADVGDDAAADGAASSDATAPAGAPSSGAELDGWDPNYTYTPSPMGGGTWSSAPSTSSGTGSTSSAPTDNASWSKLAIDTLIARGVAEPNVAADAITKWLDGAALTDAEVSAVNAAIRLLGSPPQGAPSIIHVPKPPAPGPTPPAPKVPTAPTTFAATPSPGQLSTRVAWHAPASTGGAPITSYRIERSYDNGIKWTVVANAPTASPTVLAIQQTGETWFRIAAVNRVGVSPFLSGRVHFVAKPAPPPPVKPPPPKPPTPPPPKPPVVPTVPASTRHVIKRGETLWGIVSTTYGRVTPRAVAQIARLNGLTLVGSGTSAHPSRWVVGQLITLPPKSQVTF